MSFLASYVVPFLPLATIVVALLGWWVIVRNTRRIATRSETYTIVQSLLSTTDKIESEAREYWLKNADSWTRDKAAGYVAYIADAVELLRLIAEVTKARSMEFDAISALGPLRQALTLDAERLSTVDREQRVTKVSAASADLRELRRRCYQAFMNAYPVDIAQR